MYSGLPLFNPCQSEDDKNAVHWTVIYSRQSCRLISTYLPSDLVRTDLTALKECCT